MQSEASYINQYFDHVYVLNLEHRPDRKIAMLQKLCRLGISAEFVQAINGYSYQNRLEFETFREQPIGVIGSHPLEIEQQKKLINSPGAWGYLKTYHGILQDARKRGFEKILCFDDDVLFHEDFENQFRKAVGVIPEDWKLLYLGASQFNWKIPQSFSYLDERKHAFDEDQPFYLPNRTDGSFAMGIDNSVFEILLQSILKMNCSFDSGPLREVINIYPKSCFVLYPNLVIADVSESNIRDGQDQQQLSKRMKWDLDDYNYPYHSDLVSVIMPAYNAEKTIEKSIRSILMQNYQNLELLVVDDASTDDTISIVSRLMDEDSRIRIIPLESNRGVGDARNEGIKEAKGEVIAFQDADDISWKDRISYQLIPIYEKNMLFSVCRFYRSRCTIEELDIQDQKAALALVKSKRIINKAGDFEYRDRAEVGLVTLVYRRSVFENYGLFDSHRFGEDLELVERILYYKLNKTFDENYNGHSFLSDHKSIANTFLRIDKPLYISPDMDEGNLTIQYQNKTKEKRLNERAFRNKHKSGGLEQFSKLLVSPDCINPKKIKYNTMNLDSFVLLPEIEHQILLERIKHAKTAENFYPALDKVYDSLSWRITAPLRWIVNVLNSLIRIFK